jgi:hypothetical protein
MIVKNDFFEFFQDVDLLLKLEKAIFNHLNWGCNRVVRLGSAPGLLLIYSLVGLQFSISSLITLSRFVFKQVLLFTLLCGVSRTIGLSRRCLLVVAFLS